MFQGANVAPPENYLVNGEPIDDVGGTPSPVPVAPSPTDPVATDPVATDPGPTAPDPVALPGEYNTVFNVISDWGSGFTGEVAVQNLGSETLKGWESFVRFRWRH